MEISRFFYQSSVGDLGTANYELWSVLRESVIRKTGFSFATVHWPKATDHRSLTYQLLSPLSSLIRGARTKKNRLRLAQPVFEGDFVDPLY
jgi:hypothetical protein